ncbi:MAG: D-tyrosyl-tRNA(Tyr) deacylase [Proteobacteria bacterium]|nr:D-tyrosyl-tRNA(Tyr) deacylase [Pseudomonadota bacterium]MBU1714969.1 D-tyrosyl-tRNA(Tyr) deacylase [Pseudomonadota bacterium]
MRAVVQLVSKAAVTVEGKIIGQIKAGLVVLLGINSKDTEQDAKFLADKIANLRIFPDEKKLMNLSVLDTRGDLLVISQFTLFGDCRKGRRPSYSEAAPPEMAKALYHYFIKEAEKLGIRTATGKFQAMMEVSLINNGPVTLILDSKKHF